MKNSGKEIFFYLILLLLNATSHADVPTAELENTILPLPPHKILKNDIDDVQDEYITEEDTTAEDTTAEDTTAEDTTAEDTTAEDTTAEDTTEEDTTEEDTTEEDTSEINIKRVPDDSFLSFLDAPQNYISSGVESMAKNIDEFFSEDKILYDTSGSYLKLRENFHWNEGGVFNFLTDVKFKLRLPYTEKKMHLTFESKAVQEQDTISQPHDIPSSVTNNENNYSAGIQADLGESRGWKLKPFLGIDLSPAVDPFVSLRLSREYKFTKWSINWQETPYFYDSFGWGFDSYFELNRKITEKDLFRSAAFASWREDIEYFELRQVFTMFHTLTDKKALSYFAGVYGISEPIVHTTHFLIGSTYRQNIHKDYLFAEIVPQILYQEINNFRPEHSIVFRLEMVFKR